jgi:hypothetical protein
MYVSRTGEDLAARVCDQKGIGVDLDSRIFRDLRWTERPAEG